MPNLGGIDLAQRLNELAPGVPVLFISAYPRELPTDARDLPAGVGYLQKPFTGEQIGLAIRALLARPA
jgi:two-component SAPR family response regulator